MVRKNIKKKYLRNRVSTKIPGSVFQPRKTWKNHDFSGLENNAENPKISRTQNSEFVSSRFQPGTFSGSNLEPGTQNFRVPGSNPEIFPVITWNLEIFLGFNP